MSDKLGAPWIDGEVGVPPRVVDTESLPTCVGGTQAPLGKELPLASSVGRVANELDSVFVSLGRLEGA